MTGEGGGVWGAASDAEGVPLEVRGGLLIEL